jgi:hypothetical protein
VKPYLSSTVARTLSNVACVGRLQSSQCSRFVRCDHGMAIHAFDDRDNEIVVTISLKSVGEFQ